MNTVIAGRYRTLEMVGEGSFGQVWKALDLQTERLVAVKMECRQPASTMLRHEYFTYRELEGCEGLPEVYGWSELADFNVLAMQLLGPSLLSLQARGPLPPKQICKLASQMFSTLRAIHSRGYGHRDIKPENWMLSQDLTQVHLIDFGLACKFAQGQGKGKGNLRYCSVRQQRGGSFVPGDDLEAAVYVLAELAEGSLPWAEVKGSRAQREQAVLQLKQASNHLSTSCPQIDGWLAYTRALGDSPADYHRLITSAESLL